MALSTRAEIRNYYRKVGAGLRPLAEAAMEGAMIETEAQLEEFAPVDTGEHLAGIHRDTVEGENVIGGIGFRAKHSPIVLLFNYGGGTIQALRDAKHRIRNNLVDLSRYLVKGAP